VTLRGRADQGSCRSSRPRGTPLPRYPGGNREREDVRQEPRRVVLSITTRVRNSPTRSGRSSTLRATTLSEFFVIAGIIGLGRRLGMYTNAGAGHGASARIQQCRERTACRHQQLPRSHGLPPLAVHPTL